MNTVKSPQPVCFYVYFRLGADADREDACACVRAMQRGLFEHTGVSGRLLERRDDQRTLMEIYEWVSDPGFEHLLDDAVEASGIGRFIEPGSTRHVERFVECA